MFGGHANSTFRVTKLCLLNTTSRNDPKEKRENRQKTILRAKDGHFQEVVEELLPYFVYIQPAKTM